MITKNCSVSHYYCNTALKVYTRYTRAQVESNSSNSCNSGATLSIADYVCTDNQNVFATPSASIATISGSLDYASRSAIAMGNSMYILWLALGIIILLQAIGVGTYIFKK